MATNGFGTFHIRFGRLVGKDDSGFITRVIIVCHIGNVNKRVSQPPLGIGTGTLFFCADEK
jgi:hypothetical protein